MVPSFAEIKDLMLEKKFHLMALTETWLNPEFPTSLLDIPGYNFIRSDRLTRGGGIGIYVSNVLEFAIVDLSYIENVNNIQIEHVWLGLRYKANKILIGVIYRPPAVPYSDLKAIENILAIVSPQYDFTVILGDLNINLLVNSYETIYISDILSTFNLKQVITDPTRITSNSSTLIDIIAVDSNMKVSESSTMDMYDLTDHRLVYCDISLNIEKLENKCITYRDFSVFNIRDFELDMQQIQWNALNNIRDINERTEIFNELVINVFDKHAPLKTVSLKHPYRPYITPTIKEIIKLKRNAFNKFKRTKNEVDKNYYLDLKNYLSIAIKNEKKAYMQFELKKLSNDSKKMWLRFRQWGVCNKGNMDLPNHLKDLNELVKAASDMNQYVQPVNNDLLSFYENNTISEDHPYTITVAQEEDVQTALREIKSRAMGVDNISMTMVEFILPFVIGVVTKTINDSIQLGVFPSTWKTSVIKPLPKKPNPVTYNDLRLIHLIPIFSKIAEKIVCKMLLKHIESHNILPKIQSGFRSHYSTCSALTKVANDLTAAMDQSKASCLVLLDYSKAFDLINHDMLLAKLHYIGLDPLSCKWFGDYLKNRSFIVDIDGSRSPTKISVDTGVPQGSILGPILFTIYTSDLPKAIMYCNVHLYADDVQLTASFDPSDTNIALRHLNDDLRRILNWSWDHAMVLNANKSGVLFVGSQRILSKVAQFNFSTVHIDNVEIPIKDHARNLGVTFDSQLNFEQHVANKLKTCYIKLKTLYSFKCLLPEDVKYRLIESLIFPQFDYCLPMYYNFLSSNFKHKLQVAQNACMRFVYQTKKYDHITPVYNEHKHLKIEHRYRYLFGVFLMKIFAYKCPEYLYELLIPRRNLHSLNLRNNALFNIYQHKTSRFKCSFSYVSVDYLNNPVFSNLLTSYNAPHIFKAKYKQVITTQQVSDSH